MLMTTNTSYDIAFCIHTAIAPLNGMEHLTPALIPILVSFFLSLFCVTDSKHRNAILNLFDGSIYGHSFGYFATLIHVRTQSTITTTEKRLTKQHQFKLQHKSLEKQSPEESV